MSFSIKGAVFMRKLKKYKPTAFIAEGSYYDKDAADYAVAFIEALSHTKGSWAGKPFELIDWQEQIVRDLFGILKPNGYRQFNTAYIEIPKKMGKSELAAAIALLLTCGDGEERAEVYGCAADRQQASIVFEVAADMVRMCPALNKRVKLLASTKRLVYLPTNSFYQVLSAEAYSKHGFNIHGVVFDELHTQPNRKLFDVMTKGSGDARTQPLYFLITTAGTDTQSICYETHQKAVDIIEGRKYDPTFYPVIYGAKEEDDWTDPKVWKKANPSLGITVSIDKVRAACESAKQNPAEENSFRQLRLNQWVKQSVRWMPMAKWDACAFPVKPESLEGRVCYGGLDLSSTTDITAFVLVFPPEDETDKYTVLPYFWMPEDNIDLRVRRDHVQYDLWEKQGYILTTEGNVVHYGYIEKFIEELGEKYNIREIAFDRWGAVQMVQNLEGLGFTVVPSIVGVEKVMESAFVCKLVAGSPNLTRYNQKYRYVPLAFCARNPTATGVPTLSLAEINTPLSSVDAPVKSAATVGPMSSTPRVSVPLLKSFTTSAAPSSAYRIASTNSTESSAVMAFASTEGTP
jgi:phage terminase large subunit-like protein